MSFSAPSYLVDSTPVNNPNANTVRYALTDVDSCGNEEPITSSAWQNTPFIIGNGSGTFSWSGTGYLIENVALPVKTYRLFRDTLSNGHWQAIDSVAGNQYQMTDPNYSKYPYARYRLDGELYSGGCPYNGNLRPYHGANKTTTQSNDQHNGTFTAVKQITNTDFISIYPSPVEQNINIKFNYSKVETVRVSIMDITGRIIWETQSETTSGNPLQLNLSTLSGGVYFVKVTTNTLSQVVKFIKE